jgi:ABC-2 type transport system ATP-binding protein
MTMIEARDLTKRFGETTAVDGIDLVVEEGSVHGFVGPNGAGKTTTMQMMVGLLEPTAGDVTIAGEPAGTTAANERLGYSPQELPLHESMTGRRYLEYMGRAAGMDRGEAGDRATELLAWLDLEDAATQRIDEYSGGMKRRISLAQAMIHDPELLILDEPTTGLDPTGRQQIMDALRDLPEEGITVFVSSHVLSELEQYVGTVTVLRDGEIVTTDSIEGIQRAYGGTALAIETDDDDAVVELLSDVEAARNVELEADRLVVMTDDPDELRTQLQALLVEHDISLQSMSEAGTLQETFADIVEEGSQ